MTLTDIRVSAWSLRATAGTTQTATMTWRELDDTPYDLTGHDLQVFLDGEEMAVTVDSNVATVVWVFPDDVGEYALSIVLDDQLQSTGTAYISGLGTDHFEGDVDVVVAPLQFDLAVVGNGLSYADLNLRNHYIDLREFGSLTEGADSWATAPDITDLRDMARAEMGLGDNLELPRGWYTAGPDDYSLPSRFAGQGPYLTRLGPNEDVPDGDTAFITVSQDDVYTQNNHTDGMVLENMTIDGRGREWDCPGVELKRQNRGLLRNLRIAHWRRQALKLNDSVREMRFDNVWLRHSGFGHLYPQIDISETYIDPDGISVDDPNNLLFSGLWSVYPHGDNLWISPIDDGLTRNIQINGGMFHGLGTGVNGILRNDGYEYVISAEERGGTIITVRGCRTLFITNQRPHSPGYGMPTVRLDDFLLHVGVTADAGDDVFTLEEETPLSTGTAVRFTTTGTLPAPLEVDTSYYLFAVSDTEIQVCEERADALNVDEDGEPDPIVIDITDAGTGTHHLVGVPATNGVHFVSCNFGGGQSHVQPFTADPTTNRLAASRHPFAKTGAPMQLTTTGTLPAPLATGTTYYAIRVTAVEVPDVRSSRFLLATSEANALAGTAINITDAGTGSHPFTPVCTAASAATDEFTSVGHIIATGALVRVSGAALPGGVVADTDYYAIRTGEDTFKLATSHRNAVNEVPIDLATNGTGPHFVVTQRHHGNIQRGNVWIDDTDHDGVTDNGMYRQATADQVHFGLGTSFGSQQVLETGKRSLFTGGWVREVTTDLEYTSETLATVSPLVIDDLPARAVFEFEMLLFLSLASGHATDAKIDFAINGSGGPRGRFGVLGLQTDATTTGGAPNFASSTFGTPLTFGTTSAGQTWVKVFGKIYTGVTSSDLSPKFAANTAGVTPTKILADSQLKVWRVA